MKAGGKEEDGLCEEFASSFSTPLSSSLYSERSEEYIKYYVGGAGKKRYII